jgi:hypothetical protein
MNAIEELWQAANFHKIKKRILAKTVKSISGCLEYQGTTDPCGYASVSVYVRGRQRKLGGHRLIFILDKGFIHPGNVVMHSCDNPSCVNIDHLSAGTVMDNVHDMIAKGRSKFGRGSKPGSRSKSGRGSNGIGERMRGVLSDTEIMEIRSLNESKRFTQKDIAKIYEISPRAVSYIATMQAYSDVVSEDRYNISLGRHQRGQSRRRDSYMFSIFLSEIGGIKLKCRKNGLKAWSERNNIPYETSKNWM